MPNQDEIDGQLRLLQSTRQRLDAQLNRFALVGVAHAPPDLSIDIREARAEIARIKAVLRGWGIMTDDQPNDLEPGAPLATQHRLRVFISYKHADTPDAPLAAELAASLRDSCEVFIDTELPIGARWAEQIRFELARADVVVAMMSARAAESEMVREEIAFAHTLSQAQGRPRILPVRVAFRAPFAYPLSEYFDPLQWAFWDNTDDTPALLAALRRALAGGALPWRNDSDKSTLLQPDLQPSAPPAQAPLPGGRRPALQLEPPEGSMAAESQFYITRASDTAAVAVVARTHGHGATLTIKGPRQMGKSSLLLRVAEAAANAGKQVALLDFQFFEQEALQNADVFFRQFCAWLSDALELDDRTDEYWSAGLGNSQRCTRYVERYLLKTLGKPVLLAIDEIDKTVDSPFRSDFFGMLRGWHNNRAFKPTWRQIDIALVTSTETYLLIPNPNQSPFNVGEVVPLADFGADEVGELNRRHGAPLDVAGLARLNELLGGHPYLTRRALYLLANGAQTVAALFAEAAAEHGPFGDHLRYHLFRLHGQIELVQGMQQVLRHGRCDNETVFWRLQGAGLVRGEARQTQMRNQLYAAFFGAHLR